MGVQNFNSWTSRFSGTGRPESAGPGRPQPQVLDVQDLRCWTSRSFKWWLSRTLGYGRPGPRVSGRPEPQVVGRPEPGVLDVQNPPLGVQNLIRAVQNLMLWSSRALVHRASRVSGSGRPEPQVVGRPEPQVLDVQNPLLAVQNLIRAVQNPPLAVQNPPFWPPRASDCWASRTPGSGQRARLFSQRDLENSAVAATGGEGGETRASGFCPFPFSFYTIIPLELPPSP